jgi:hypothetical protein
MPSPRLRYRQLFPSQSTNTSQSGKEESSIQPVALSYSALIARVSGGLPWGDAAGEENSAVHDDGSVALPTSLSDLVRNDWRTDRLARESSLTNLTWREITTRHHMNSIWTLRQAGCDIVWSSARYCRAILDGHEIILRWTSDGWVRV